ncbi:MULTISPECIES: hypothetical protein [unclassified Nonomuraea]|uniref:hypothetical protein n=1 Tax=unclassified Nonomuraea TaxID=2593643 RepID=UPI0033F3DC12
MSEPVVVAGLGILGVPPLPDVGVLDRHIAVLDTVAAHHRRLVSEGVSAYQLAARNQGPAADSLHAFMTSRDGALPQAEDLAGRFTAAAGGLRVTRSVIVWVGGVLAGAAVAAGVAVVVAPQFLPRLTAMARRLVLHLRGVMSRMGRMLKLLLRSPRTRRIDKVAGRLHDEWRASRLLSDGTYEPRLKTTTDKAWARRHGTDQVDIANTRYDDLPPDWQKENRDSATVAVNAVDRARRNGVDLRSPDFMEDASEHVHDMWLQRNNDWAPPEQRLKYGDLSEVEKEKDRVVVREALDVLAPKPGSNRGGLG